jgi:hypothetical protein
VNCRDAGAHSRRASGPLTRLNATVEAASERGGEVRLPRFAVPGVGWQAYLADTEGNLFGVLQADSSAP